MGVVLLPAVTEIFTADDRRNPNIPPSPLHFPCDASGGPAHLACRLPPQLGSFPHMRANTHAATRTGARARAGGIQAEHGTYRRREADPRDATVIARAPM
ncbi:hypothetical protein ABZP36_023013 [Zizania latifolia]